MVQKSMPLPDGIAGAGFFSGISATIASQVSTRPATDAASCSAVRTTLVGSMIPAWNMSLYSLACASKPQFTSLFSSSFPTTMGPSAPAFSTICRIGALRALAHDVDADLLIAVLGVETVDRVGGVKQCSAAAGDDTLFDGGFGGVHRIVDPIVAFLDFDLGRAADPDHRDASELCQALLELLAVVI